MTSLALGPLPAALLPAAAPARAGLREAESADSSFSKRSCFHESPVGLCRCTDESVGCPAWPRIELRACVRRGRVVAR